MAKKRANGEGNIRKRKDGRWEGRYTAGYDEKTGKGLIRHALIRYGFKTKKIMVCLVVNGKKLPKAERLIEKLIQIEGMTSITISPNTRRDNVIMGDSYEILWGQGYITDYIGNLKL